MTGFVLGLLFAVAVWFICEFQKEDLKLQKIRRSMFLPKP